MLCVKDGRDRPHDPSRRLVSGCSITSMSFALLLTDFDKFVRDTDSHENFSVLEQDL